MEFTGWEGRRRAYAGSGAVDAPNYEPPSMRVPTRRAPQTSDAHSFSIRGRELARAGSRLSGGGPRRMTVRVLRRRIGVGLVILRAMKPDIASRSDVMQAIVIPHNGEFQLTKLELLLDRSLSNRNEGESSPGRCPGW